MGESWEPITMTELTQKYIELCALAYEKEQELINIKREIDNVVLLIKFSEEQERIKEEKIDVTNK